VPAVQFTALDWQAGTKVPAAKPRSPRMIIHTAGVRATIASRFIDHPSIIGCLSPLAAWIAVKI